MSTRSMAARRRRAADRRKKRDTPAPRPAKLIPGPAPNPVPTANSALPAPKARRGALEREPEPELEAAGVGARSGRTTMPPLDDPDADDLRYIQEQRLPPLAASDADLDPDLDLDLDDLDDLDLESERPPLTGSARAVTVRRYRDSSGASQSSPAQSLSQPPRLQQSPLRPRDGFTWRERDWGALFWLRPLRRLPTVIISLVLLAVVLGGTFLLVTRTVGHETLHLTSPFATHGTPTPRTQPVIIQPGTTETTPTPAFPQYTIGVWAADPSPPGAGSDQLFARISNDTLPAKGIIVNFSIVLPNGSITSGPLRTDGHGLVSYTLVYSSPANQPIQVTATATTPGGTISATIYIVPV